MSRYIAVLLLLMLNADALMAEVLTNESTRTFPTYADLEVDEFAQTTRLEELLNERRFRVEMIVFARAEKTDLGEEPLLTIEPRVLPENIFGLTPATAQEDGYNASYCIGYPNIASEPALPKKLLEILRKKNEPELSQWYSESALSAYANGNAQEEALLQEDFLEESPIQELARNDITTPLNSPKVMETLYLNFISQLSVFINEVKATSYQTLPSTEFRLREEALILDRNPKFSLLLHESWQQVVPPRAAPQQIYFTAKDAANTLQGLVSVTLGRYLHFAGQLWLEAPVEDYLTEQALRTNSPAINNDQAQPKLSTQLPSTRIERSPLEQELVAKKLITEDLLTQDNIPIAYFELNESRRMRSEEIHYLDHPALGIIVKITLIEAPESLVQAWKELERYRKPPERNP
jgi:hypothetical protein